MDKVIRVGTRRDLATQGAADLRYWLSRPVHERLAAVEQLRQQYIAEHFDAEPRLQRVYRVTQRARAGVDLPIIHVDDFKTNKRATGRFKDLADLEALEGDPEG